MTFSTTQLNQIKKDISKTGLEFGFQDAKVSDCETDAYFDYYQRWLENNYHGSMSYLARNQSLRKNPAELHPNTLRVVSFRYNYLPVNAHFADTLEDPNRANISRYALGKDYHKLLRKKLSQLAERLKQNLQDTFNLDYRVFVDSAPVLETAFAEKSGLGWKGKHTLIINKDAGSWFFLGEIFINIPLPVDTVVEDLCGSCSACISLCPTKAIIAPNKLDATRCISYLTIENKNEIPVEFRKLMGNRIYGCDDCQLACPWNRYSQQSLDVNFYPRNSLDNISLLELWKWNEIDFLKKLEGSPIRRIGFQSWLRNLAVAIGNGDYDEATIFFLNKKKLDANNMVIEHIDWAIDNLKQKKDKAKGTKNKQTEKLIRCINIMLPRDA